MKLIQKHLLLAGAILITFSCKERRELKQGKPAMNVLFICVDDLRPALGCYGDEIVKTPNIDRLVSQGIAFDRAYCQQAICGPSRASVLTGLRPVLAREWGNKVSFRETVPDAVTLPEYFKQNGYYTLNFGKIFHHNDPQSWSEPAWYPKAPAFLTPEGQREVMENDRKEFTGIPYEAPDVADNELKDGQTADAVVEALRQVKDRRFFIAAGFLKPHLPFVAPKKYWDLYDQSQFNLVDNPMLPDGTSQNAVGNYEELQDYLLRSPGWPITDEEARSLMHGYYACVSYVDAQIGKVLDELDRLNLREKTIIVLWGDHGFHFGEHGHWAKATNFEVATRSPLIISIPGQSNRGVLSNALVELVDIYPTLCDISGIGIPATLEGQSFKPVLDNPEMQWKKAAFSQYPRSIPGKGKAMGYSMRTDRYRYNEWLIPGSSFLESELYDHHTDPGENVNLAKRSEFGELVKTLSSELHEGFEKVAKKSIK